MISEAEKNRLFVNIKKSKSLPPIKQTGALSRSCEPRKPVCSKFNVQIFNILYSIFRICLVSTTVRSDVEMNNLD